MKLAEYRAKHKIAQAKFADMIGMDVTTVSKYENGEISPSLASLHKIHRVTEGQVTLEDFVPRETSRESD